MNSESSAYGGLLNLTPVLELMDGLLSPEAHALLHTRITNADLVCTPSGYRTLNGTSELITLGIRTTQRNLNLALIHLADELNLLAAQGLWDSTLAQPATIDLAPSLPFIKEIILTCYITIPTDKAPHVKATFKGYYEELKPIYELK